MALELKLRNRIVGLLVIASAILIALPAIMNHDEERNVEENKKAESVNNSVFNTNTDDKDYTQLLTNNTSSQSGLIESNKINSDEALVVESSTSANRNPSSVDLNKGLIESNNKAQDETLRVDTEKKESVSAKAPVKTEVLTASNKAPKETLKASSNNAEFDTYTQIKGQFSVQVGTYSKQASAKNMASKLKSAGINAYYQTISRNGSNLIRVYAASSPNKENLKSVLDQVKKVTGAVGIIVKVQ